jgi:hypothetical protein
VLGPAAQVLIEQQIAVVRSICEVVDNQQLAAMQRNCRFPAVIKGVMVYNQPVWLKAGQDSFSLMSVSFPVAAKPCGVTRLFSVLVWGSGSNGGLCERRLQACKFMPALTDDLLQVAGVLATDETALRTFGLESVG